MHPILAAVGSTSFALSPPAVLAQYAPQQQPQQPYGGSGMQSGGLSPPPSHSDPESLETERELSEAELEDSGRGLEFFYVNAEIGAEHLGLQTFKANDLVDAGVVETTQTGPTYGAGLGVRLLFLTIGARFRLSDFSAWQLWTLNGEVGFRVPLGNLEPYFFLGGGYASLGAFGADDVGGGVDSENVDIDGYNIRGGGGFDYYITPVLSVGASLSAELIGLARSGVSASAGGQAGQIYAAGGSGLGFGVTGTAVIGLHL